MNFNTPDFQMAKMWISGARVSNISWDDIRTGYGAQSINDFLSRTLFWKFDLLTWEQFVEYMRKEEETRNSVVNRHTAATIIGTDQNNCMFIPQDDASAWVNYKARLLNEKGYTQEAVDNIERSCFETLKCLSINTSIDDPRKGLVIGSVQSGKTGQMAGLMAMAADWGWNMFIVFSGSLENLRIQTEDRLLNDLINPAAVPTWIKLPREAQSGFVYSGFRTRDLRLARGDIKYLSVCLKNSIRMRNLLDWLHTDPNVLSNMRILVIDDEADQASVNTSDVDLAERSTLNGLLCNLVNARMSDGTLSRGFGAMNYVAYTATPYANLLNESGRESLYPRHFINTLEASKEYFGPQQIFGDIVSGYEGMDILRDISAEEIQYVTDLYGRSGIAANDMPESLADSICWYLCCVANMRCSGYKRPLSMLVHTSMNTDHHAVIAKLIESWLASDKQEIISRCKTVWDRETSRFGRNEFAAQYPDYSRMSDVPDYKDFDAFSSYIDELLEEVHPMQIDAKGNITYHKGIHLCVDNSTERINPNGEYVRLLYPDTSIDFASAFIVVGGNTLSRGLTIQGLVSTYFFRSVMQADTLMQMGRWFGYRVGYELLPRIWMTEDARDKFIHLTKLDSDLRYVIKRMIILGQTPDKYPAHVMCLPRYIKITGANRMQGAVEADLDFSGTLLQTTTFDNKADVLLGNLDVTSAFISNLGPKSSYNSYSPSNIIWQNVSFDSVKDYLQSYRFNDKVKRLNDVEPLLDWLDKMHQIGELDSWNVVLCSVHSQKQYTFGDITIGKIERTRLQSPDDVIYIKTLTSPSDFISDLDKDTMPINVRNMISSGVDTRLVRSSSNLSRCPQLLIYVVDKDSKAKCNSVRLDLNAPHDIVGLAINIPGHTDIKNNVRSIRVRMDDDSLIHM